MNDSSIGRVAVLVVLIAALVSAVVNVLMKGVFGSAIFQMADIPLRPLLPDFLFPR